mmetsp:Transcript_66619/g.210944  ORF Transcript_66619/g.210944 Transcript_66619/m.210944 type:complete len:242 (+) Transcript_66619:589-1314(+)
MSNSRLSVKVSSRTSSMPSTSLILPQWRSLSALLRRDWMTGSTFLKRVTASLKRGTMPFFGTPFSSLKQSLLKRCTFSSMSSASISSKSCLDHSAVMAPQSFSPCHMASLRSTSSLASSRSGKRVSCTLKRVWWRRMRAASSSCLVTRSLSSLQYLITSSWLDLSSRIISFWVAALRMSTTSFAISSQPFSRSVVKRVTFSSRVASTSSIALFIELKSGVRVWKAASSMSATGILNTSMRS